MDPYQWDDNITINVTAKLSMIDGKIRNQLTGNPASQRCSFCHLLPADFLENGKPKKEFSTSMDALWCFQDLCISPLHCCLRIFEALYRIGYLQDVKKGRVNKHIRAKVNERKQRIQNEFKKKGMKIGKFLLWRFLKLRICNFNPLTRFSLYTKNPFFVICLHYIYSHMFTN